VIERAILLHHDDDVLDILDGAGDGCRGVAMALRIASGRSVDPAAARAAKRMKSRRLVMASLQVR
jgi:hypothetical protein